RQADRPRSYTKRPKRRSTRTASRVLTGPPPSPGPLGTLPGHSIASGVLRLISHLFLPPISRLEQPTQVRRDGFLFAGAAVLIHLLLPVNQLGQMAVVGPTHQADIGGVRRSTEPVGIPVVMLEAVSLGASSSLPVHEAASASVAAIDETSYGR